MKRKVISVVMAAFWLTACGGGGDSSSGGGASNEAALDQFALNWIQFYTGMPDYEPNQAEIDCVRALPENDDQDLERQRVQACVDNN